MEDSHQEVADEHIVESESGSGDGMDAPRRIRSRKSVERTVPSVASPKRKLSAVGSGTLLGEISKINEVLTNKFSSKDDAVKRLHRILFGSDGVASARKRAIRTWAGTQDQTKLVSGLAGAKSVGQLKEICAILGLSGSGDRASVEARVVEFLVHPTGSTGPLKKKKKMKKMPKDTKKSKLSSTLEFANFLKNRLPQVTRLADGTMTPAQVTELLALEWKAMVAVKKVAPSPSPSPRKNSSRDLSPHKISSPGKHSSAESSSEHSSSSSSSGTSSDDSCSE